MVQSRLKPGAGITDLSASTMNRLFELERRGAAGMGGAVASLDPWSIRVVGRNDCGYTLEPGSPVILGSFTQELAGFGNGRNGWYSLRPCYLPINATEEAALGGDLFNVGVVSSNAIATEALGEVAIAGVVEVKCASSAYWWIAPSVQSGGLYQTAGVPNPSFGFARKVCELSGGFCLADLNRKSFWSFAYNSGSTPARSGATAGDGIASLQFLSTAGVIVNPPSAISVPFKNWAGTTIADGKLIVIERNNNFWTIKQGDC